MRRSRGGRRSGQGPHDIAAIRNGIRDALRTADHTGEPVGRSKFGVYAFYDYDGEPIYVGQTYEGLGSRIGRHLTGQRSDAVVKNVLDPLEVAEIEMWPMHDLKGLPLAEAKGQLNDVEYTVFEKLESESAFQAVLNEARPAPGKKTTLPPSVRLSIVPGDVRERLKHPDLRIARRASTIAGLAKVISEREGVSAGLRKTLITQAKRLLKLAERRASELTGGQPEEAVGEETGGEEGEESD